MKIKKVVCVFLSLMIMMSLCSNAFAQNIEEENCHSMTNKWFGGDINLFASLDECDKMINQYFLIRNESFLSQETIHNEILSDEVVLLENKRRNNILSMQSKMNIKVTDSENHITIKEKTNSGSLYNVYVYEWIFYDYDDLDVDGIKLNVSGYGVEHTISLDLKNHIIVFDEYDEYDMTGICNKTNNNSNEEMQLNSVQLMSVPNLYTNYNVDDVVDYADKYVKNGATGGVYESYYNPQYGNFNSNGGDCANYTSQCIYAGGMPQVKCSQYGTSGWYYNSSSDRSATWTSSTNLRTWMSNNRGNLVDNPSASQIYKGSPVFYDWGNSTDKTPGTGWDHTTICVGKNSEGIPIINSHNNDKYHVKWNYGYTTTKYSTVQLTSSDYNASIQLTSPSNANAYDVDESLSISWTKPTGANYFKYSIAKLKWVGTGGTECNGKYNNLGIYGNYNNIKISGTSVTIPANTFESEGAYKIWVACYTDSSYSQMLSETIGYFTMNQYNVDNTPYISSPTNGNQYVHPYDVNITWKQISGATAYLVSIKNLDTNVSLCERKNIGKSTSMYVRDYYSSGLDDNTNYRIAVGAVIPSGECWDEGCVIHTAKCPVINTISNSSSCDPSNTTVSWTATPGAKSYGFILKKSDGIIVSGYNEKSVGTSRSYTFTDLQPNTSYTLGVYAIINDEVTDKLLWAKSSTTFTTKSSIVPVTGINLNKTSLTLEVGDRETLTATIKPSNATNQNVDWTTSSDCVSVAMGHIIACEKGTAVITAATEDGNYKAYCTVTVTDPKPNSYTITYDLNGASASTIRPQIKTEGEDITLTTTIPTRSGYTFLGWATSKTATTAKYQPGDTFSLDSDTILYAVWEIKNDPIIVTAIKFTNYYQSLHIGETVTLSPTITPSTATNSDLVWTSSYPEIASVDSNGKVTAKALGSTTITAENSTGSVSRGCYVTVFADGSMSDFIAEEGELIQYTGTAKNVVIPENVRMTDKTGITVTSISKGLFNNTNIESIVFPHSLQTINREAIRDCTSLKSVEIPDSVGYIGSQAFDGCSSLKRVVIPSSVASGIDTSTFRNCSSIVEIIVDENNTEYSSDERGVLYDKNKTFLYHYPGANKSSEYILPKETTYIGGYSLADCTNLKKLYLHKNIIYIGGKCTSITDIYYEGTETEWNSVTGFTLEYFPNATLHFSYSPDNPTNENIISISAPNGNVDDTITISVGIDSEYSVIGGSFNLYYDKDKMELVEAQKGALFGSVEPVINDNYADNAVRLTFSALNGIVANGTLLTAKFKLKSVGNADLSVTDVKFGKSDGTYIYGEDAEKTIAISEKPIETLYYVTYDANGGENEPTTQSKNSGSTLKLSTVIPTREGYTFLGWAIKSDATEAEYQAGGSYTKNESLTLYAIWEENGVVISGVDSGGIVWKFYENGKLSFFGTGAMQNYSKTSAIPWYDERNNITEVLISDGITSIGDRTLYNCINLGKITIPSSVETIGLYALRNCDEVTIYGESKSYAKTYAENNEIPFVNITLNVLKNLNVDFAQTSKKWYFNISVDDCDDDAAVYVAIFDEDNRLLTAAMKELVIDDITSLSFDKILNAKYAKIFVWKNDMQPITNAVVQELN